MFCIVAALSESGFFTYLALMAARRLNYDPVRILVVFPIVTGVLACFVDSITVMLFFASLTFELARLLKVDPVPLVVAEPPNVILGTMLGYNFNDFVTHTGPIALMAGAASVAYFYFQFRGRMRGGGKVDWEELKRLVPASAIVYRKLMNWGLAAFALAIVFLIIHLFLEHAGIQLTVPLASLLSAFGMLILGGPRTERLLHRVEYEVLLFFMGLFVVVGGLEKTGVIHFLAEGVAKAFEGNTTGLIAAFVWGTGVTSGVVDDVPFALTMASVIKEIAATTGTLALSIMVWAVALGTDIGGSFTPIGASANVVAYHSLEKKGVTIGWLRWIRLALPCTTVALIISTLMLIAKNAIRFY